MLLIQSASRLAHLDVISAHYGLGAAGAGASNITDLADSQCGRLDTVDLFDADRGKTASWVTTTAASCVGRAFDWALSHLAMEGTLAEIESRWFPRGPCRASNSTGSSDVAWSTTGAMSVEELSGAFLVWLLGLLLTAFGWILPGSHEIIHGSFRGMRRRPTTSGNVLAVAATQPVDAVPATDKPVQMEMPGFDSSI